MLIFFNTGVRVNVKPSVCTVGVQCSLAVQEIGIQCSLSALVPPTSSPYVYSSQSEFEHQESKKVQVMTHQLIPIKMTCHCKCDSILTYVILV